MKIEVGILLQASVRVRQRVTDLQSEESDGQNTPKISS